jgi:hypothetical protein
VTNTLSDKLLTNVRVKLTPADASDTRLKPVCGCAHVRACVLCVTSPRVHAVTHHCAHAQHVVVPLAKLPYGVDGVTYCSYKLAGDSKARVVAMTLRVFACVVHSRDDLVHTPNDTQAPPTQTFSATLRFRVFDVDSTV